MSSINPIGEDTPLLRDQNGPEAAKDYPILSRWQRFKTWAADHFVNLILTILLVFFVALFLIVALVRHPRERSPSNPTPGLEAEVCSSAGCVLASATLLRSISPRFKELDPCDDFRTYVCEGFDDVHEIREDQSGVDSLQIMSEEGQLLLKRIVESPAPADTSLFWTASSPDQEIFAKMQDGYNACLNETLLKSIGSKPLLDLVSQLQEIYPVKNPKGKGDATLTDAVKFLISIGVEGPISLGVGADDKDPDSNVISLSPAWSFGLPSKQYYNKSDVVTRYKDTISSILEALLKESTPKSTVLSTFRATGTLQTLNKKVVDDLVELESQMAAASPDPEDLSDITKVYNPHTLDEAEVYNPSISVKSIIEDFTDGYKPSKIIVASPEYLKALSKILASQKRDTIQSYLIWKVVQAYGGAVEDDALTPLRRFRNILQGKEPDVRPERWRTCISVVDSDLPWILSRFFIERAFSKEAKDLGDQIIHDIKNEFSVKLTNSDWMTEKVRKLAIDKVELIRQKIGYPTRSPDVTNAEELQKYYNNVNISADSFFANRLSSSENGVLREWAQVGKPVDKDEWGMSASTVNAYYNPPGNEIVFPAGIMQAPVFYDPSIPKYLSYGAFGAVAGHELSHAFDSSGRNYDQNGNYTDWWDKSTIDAFQNKTDCFVEQYHNYTIPTKDGPLPINGKLTLGENIADAGGLTAAFQSWRRRDDEKADLMLPGLDHFTKEQIFFLAYGLTWCGKIREEEAVQRIYTDPHSPNAFRVQGTTANSREFREAFNCPVKEPTCELW
ncbi:Endothelin-converting enzyme 1 [Cytospora mali]|uniref:Endothelin-converting enzyme 1 n=1 Tax=Cytospora mali TaxID=578113 RepID=A0A194W6G8_CYTMA|nr:Endothelin-converting enzyme 1 [Valsa mali]